MTMPLTNEEAMEIIHQWYKLMDAKPRRGYLVDFFQILDEEIIIQFKNKIFKGYRGFEDHQEGKRALFDEARKINFVSFTSNGREITVNTIAIYEGRTWQPPSTVSQYVKTRQDVTWIIKRSNSTQNPVIVSHVANDITVLEGMMPNYLEASHDKEA